MEDHSLKRIDAVVDFDDMTANSIISTYAIYANEVEPSSRPVSQVQPSPPAQSQQGTPLPQDTVTLSTAALQASAALQSSGSVNQDADGQ
jgi:hypothetical protein